MYLKKRGTVLISTVIILSLISTLGCFIFKMMKNNNELGALYKFDKDIYDLDKGEEEVLHKFMEELNKNIADESNKKNKESINVDIGATSKEAENEIINDKEDVFLEDFLRKIDNNTLQYNENANKIFLITYKDNQIKRSREINHIFRNGKIILIPTYKFEDNAY